MKFIAVLLTAACLQTAANGYSQETISLSVKNAELKKVFLLIQKKTSFRFLYHDDAIPRDLRVNIEANNKPVTAVLDEALQKTSLRYRLLDNNLVVISVTNTKGDFVYEFQEVVIKGKITDEQGQALGGVSITLKGTKEGVSTNASGEFTISANTGDILEFSMVGYKTQSVKIGETTTLNITMALDVSGLTDVVVVGYGKAKKATLVGSVVSVNQRELKQSPVANLSNALAGRLPGLIAIQNSGSPGADAARLLVRGYSTVNNNEPLILVDGVERSLTSIDPEEVESISILKDASATAVYGVVGGNGVILVTTRRGRISKPSVSFTAQHSTNIPTRLPEFLNSYDYAVLRNEAVVNDNPSASKPYSDADLAHYKNGTDPIFHPNSDWLDVLYRNASNNQRYNLSITGGNENVKYFVTGAYFTQEGLFKKYAAAYDNRDLYKRWNFRSNIDIAINKDFDIAVDLAGVINSIHRPRENNVIGAAYRIPPNSHPIFLPDGRMGGTGGLGNPVAELSRTGFTESFDGQAQGTFRAIRRLSWITPGLSTGLNFSFDRNYYYSQTRAQTFALYRWDTTANPDKSVRVTTSDSSSLGPITESTGSPANALVYALNFDFFIKYIKNLGDHDIESMLLYNQRKRVINGAQYGKPFYNQGIVARITYDYQDKYLAEFNGRYDGSENFQDGERFGFFPSLAVGWVASNETFLQKVPWINYLKLRGSYGIVGNSAGVGRFLWQTFYLQSSANEYLFGPTGNVGSLGIREDALGNANVTWEKHHSLDIGLEAVLFNSKLNVNFDFFRKNVKDILIIRQTIPAIFGQSLKAQNIGETESHGFELELIHNNTINKNLRYTIKGNLNYATSKRVFVDEPERRYAYQRRTGTRIGQYFGLVNLGYFQDQGEINRSPAQFGTLIPGDIKYLDANGDGKIDVFDEMPIGKSDIPEYTMGFSAAVFWKGFDISFLAQGAFGGYTYFQQDAAWEFFNGAKVQKHHLGRWTPQTAATATYPALHTGQNANNHTPTSDYWLVSSDYIRLKNFEVGYNLPVKWVQKARIQRARVFVNGQNMITWIKEEDRMPFDPEAPSGRGWFYPQQKIINVGASITF